jgi:hypothetical protein
MANRPLWTEFVAFIVHERKWWMLPMIVVLMIMGLLVLAGNSPVAPFIYPLF